MARRNAQGKRSSGRRAPRQQRGGMLPILFKVCGRVGCHPAQELGAKREPVGNNLKNVPVGQPSNQVLVARPPVRRPYFVDSYCGLHDRPDALPKPVADG